MVIWVKRVVIFCPIEERTDTGVRVVLDHVVKTTVTISPVNNFYDFRNYDHSKVDGSQLARDLLEILKEVGFTKHIYFWHKP